MLKPSHRIMLAQLNCGHIQKQGKERKEKEKRKVENSKRKLALFQAKRPRKTNKQKKTRVEKCSQEDSKSENIEEYICCECQESWCSAKPGEEWMQCIYKLWAHFTYARFSAFMCVQIVMLMRNVMTELE
ncbi:hypothetical protein PR048_006414 [Dryococelus australis]|uniref:Recombination activating protein 1 n=1 Tax=Dryococelus australis TaxID=614101 RepID=A0ABQ9ID53_9NEOP|nr:hypothetical protein PR048_006414 [Dryococelus australis]